MRAFISYSSHDRALARKVAELLRVRGIAVWIDEGEIGPGDSLIDRLASALSVVDVFVVVYTDNARNSPWVQYELRAALTRMIQEEVKIILLRFDHSPIPDSLHGIVWADCRTDSDLRQAINAATGNQALGSAMSDAEVRSRHSKRESVVYGLRMIPSEAFQTSGLLGPADRRYVFIGDYTEQQGRSLRQILSSLGIGDSFDRARRASLDWTALIFEIGAVDQHKLDLMPGSWKAVFRILSDRSRLGLIEPSAEEAAKLGTRPRDYICGDQKYWYRRITSSSRRADGIGPDRLFPDSVLQSRFGIDNLSFEGEGLSNRTWRGPLSRIFLTKNARISDLTHHYQELGNVDDGIILW